MGQVRCRSFVLSPPERGGSQIRIRAWTTIMVLGSVLSGSREWDGDQDHVLGPCSQFLNLTPRRFFWPCFGMRRRRRWHTYLVLVKTSRQAMWPSFRFAFARVWS